MPDSHIQARDRKPLVLRARSKRRGVIRVDWYQQLEQELKNFPITPTLRSSQDYFD